MCTDVSRTDVSRTDVQRPDVRVRRRVYAAALPDDRGTQPMSSGSTLIRT